MNKATSSNIERTIKDNQNHRSQVIAKGRRQLQRTSSRPRSAKERQDALEKIIQFRKKTKTPKKKISKKVIYIKEKKQKEEKTSKNIQTSNKTLSKIQKQEKEMKENNDIKAKKSTQSKPAKEQEETNELESTTLFSFSKDHHHEEKPTEKNGTTSNSNFLSANFTDDATSSKTSKIQNQHASTNNDCTTEKDIKENNKVQSITSFSFSKDQHHEEKSSEKHGTITTTGSLNLSFTDDVFSLKRFKKITTRKRKHKHASTNKNSTTTKNYFSETDDFTFTDSTCTDTTEMASSNNFIDVAPEINELNIKNTEKESKKNSCRCWSIVFTIGGFILLFTAYYFGTNMLEEKCKRDIGNYVKNLSIKNISVEKSLEAFKEKNTNTYCKWIWKSKQKIIFGEKTEGKYKDQIDKFFEQYAKQQTKEYLLQFDDEEKRKSVKEKENLDFFNNQKFYEDEIDYKPLTTYYKQKKKDLEENKDLDLIPTYIEVSGFEGNYEDLNGKYEPGNCSNYKNSRTIGYINTRHRSQKTPARFTPTISEWILHYSSKSVHWLNTDINTNPHPGTLFGTQKPVKADKKTPIDNIVMTNKFFPEKES